jgi:hypothetical protein
MRNFFRSEQMYLYQVAMSKDEEYEVADMVGLGDMAHFIEMN